VWPKLFLTPKRDHVKTQTTYIYLYFFMCNPKRDLGGSKYWRFARNTLSETESKIYNPKRDDEHPRLFHMGVPPPRGIATAFFITFNTSHIGLPNGLSACSNCLSPRPVGSTGYDRSLRNKVYYISLLLYISSLLSSFHTLRNV